MKGISYAYVYTYIIDSLKKDSKMITDFGHEISWNQYNLNLLNHLQKLFTVRDCVVIDWGTT